MKNLLSVIIVLSISMAFIMCAGEEKQEVAPEPKPEAAVKAELIDCPGCDMKMEKSKMVAHVADGDTTYFCGEGCKDHYLAKQEKKSM